MNQQIISDIRKLLNEGISLIATGEDKIPPNKWKERGRLSEIELMDDLFKRDCECVAVRLGSQSDGLMCIDIDEKHHVGISQRFFNEFKVFFPELWEKIRVERTPSGGFHLFFRIEGECPPTKFVAYRETSEEERVKWVEKWKRVNPDKEKVPKAPVKECFLEIRGEGGLCQTSPSIGYKIVRNGDVEIVRISNDDYLAIESFCFGFNEYVVQDKEVEVKGKKQEEDWYQVNPFEDYNNRDEGKVLEQQGWKYQKSSGGKDWYSKPGRSGKSAKDIDAWYNSEKSFYNIFSTNCGIDAKGYSPANLLAQLKFDGDKKKTWAYLVEMGFGVLKKSVELKIIQRRVLDGLPLPKNISESSRLEYEEQKGKRDENYPYGTFWTENEDGVVKLNLEQMLQVSTGLGFRSYRGQLCRINFGRVEILENRYYFDELKSYVKLEGNQAFDVLDSFERIIHTYGKSLIGRLKEIKEESVLKSEKYKSYKFFNNCFVEIDKDSCLVREYSELEDGKLILDECISKRDFKLLEEAGLKKYNNTLYYDYLTKAIVSEKPGTVDLYLMKCIGFMVHDYKDQESFLISALEADEEVGGGSGKNIFYQTLGKSITFKEIAASLVKNDNTFLQSWNRQRLLHLSDVPKKYDLTWLKNIIDQGASVRKLYKDEYEVGVHDAPKICLSSNFSVDTTDVGIKRRLRQIEFTDFFIKAGGVREYYGKMFCDDWNEEDFMYFDNFIIECLQVYLLYGGKIDKKDFTETGLNKQFEQSFSHLHDFIKDNMQKWLGVGFVPTSDFNKAYDDFCKENKIYKPFSPFNINKALKSYCENHNIEYSKDEVKRETGGGVTRGKHFGKKKDEVKEDLPF